MSKAGAVLIDGKVVARFDGDDIRMRGMDETPATIAPMKFSARITPSSASHAPTGMAISTSTTVHPTLRLGPLVLDVVTQAVTMNNEPIKLRHTEERILALLIHHKGRTVPIEAFSVASANSLKVQVCALRAKLRAAGAPDMIGTVWSRGYIAREPDPVAFPRAKP